MSEVKMTRVLIRANQDPMKFQCGEESKFKAARLEQELFGVSANETDIVHSFRHPSMLPLIQPIIIYESR